MGQYTVSPVLLDSAALALHLPQLYRRRRGPLTPAPPLKEHRGMEQAGGAVLPGGVSRGPTAEFKDAWTRRGRSPLLPASVHRVPEEDADDAANNRCEERFVHGEHAWREENSYR